MLEIRDLHVQFHGSDHEAVRGIDLTVGDGEIVGLVGESGSGKTVTAMMISGLLRPEQASFRGKILLDGRDLLTSSGDTLRSIQGKDICVVFQEPMSAMDPTMRIGPQVEECLRVHTDLPPGKRRELALQALRDVDLPEAEEVYRKYPHELSGGMLQRAMIAAAIIRNVGEYGGGYTVYMGEINDIGGICLSLFLGMAMITLKLWQLAELALPLIVLLAGQTLFMILYVVLVVFNIMGRDYDAAVIVSGTCGFGMGATPNAMANMQAICDKYSPSVKAYLLIPLVGSLFADFLNSLVITVFINFI